AAKAIPLIIVLLYATEEATSKVRARLKAVSRAELHICNVLGDTDRAFPAEGFGFWADEQMHDRAKALCIRLGTGLYKDALGYGSQSLLIAFPDTCPNNNLPILFASRSGAKEWRALLPRPVS